MWNISLTLLAFNFINKNEYGSAVAILYNCNNVFLSVIALTSSIHASKSPAFLYLKSYEFVALTLIILLIALYFFVDTILKIIECLPLVNNACYNLL